MCGMGLDGRMTMMRFIIEAAKHIYKQQVEL